MAHRLIKEGYEMTSPGQDIVQLMKDGSGALNSGHTEQAADLFMQAEQAMGPSPTAEVKQSIGICLRMLKRYDDAEDYFRVAFELAQTALHRGRIMRDWAMVPLELGDYARAIEYLADSDRFLQPNQEDTDDEANERKIEYFVTLGFLARALGKQGDRRLARSYHQSADGQLRGIAPYELNNLVWWVKVESLVSRYELVWRAWKLARAARNKKRQREIVLLAISRHLSK